MNWYNEATKMIRRANQQGASKVTLYQNRRYLTCDAVSVDGRWYPVYTDINRSEPIGIVGELVNNSGSVNPKWLDDNGRYITE